MRRIMAATAAGLMAFGAGAQEASQVPEPGPEPVRMEDMTRYEVLFGFKRETLDAEATERLSHLTDDVVQGGADTALVVGHTDTVGDPETNFALGLRRAQEVRRNLIARGVPPGAITITSVGQDGLAVETGDDVRLRRNRRVVIDVAGFGTFPAPDPLTPYSAPVPPAAPID
jgi:outer membrane protein OmpA-like peptidoglycan-associated protein